MKRRRSPAGRARKFGGVNHRVYEKVFELILRLKGNYLWPAMWGNAFADDDSLDASLADEYGIVMGTSHHEPMLRAQQEWKRYGKGAWNYEHNDSTLRAFWRQGIRAHGRAREHRDRRHARRRRHADDRRAATSRCSSASSPISERSSPSVTGKTRPQRRSSGPSIRKCRTTTTRACASPTTSRCSSPTTTGATSGGCHRARTTPRAGGFGVYYHFDYVGGPRNYKWLNTNPIARVWEQMHLASRVRREHASGS